MPNISITLSTDSQKILNQFIDDRLKNFDIEARRNRMDSIDRALQLEQNVRRQKDNDSTLDYFDDIQIGTISPAIDTIHGFFCDLYVSSTPIFPVLGVGDDALNAIGQFNAALEQEERDFCWGRQLSLWFRQAAKYNVAALACEYVHRVTTKVAAGAPSLAGGEAALSAASITGNELVSWNMYNTFYDDGVPVADICREGEFAAHVEAISQIRLAMHMENLAHDGGKLMNTTTIYRKYSTTSAMQYFKEPHITDYSHLSRKTGGWDTIFNEAFDIKTSAGRNSLSSKSMYERITFYCRIIPSMFGIKNVPAPNSPSLFRIVRVHDTIIFCELQSNVHGLMPVVFAQPREENIGEQTKSTAELLIPLQNLSTKIYDARLAALARATNDRLVYVKGIVDQRDIESNSPVSRIGFKPSSLYTRASDVVSALPFQDTIGGTLINELNYLDQQGQKLTRMNRPQQGQFQKGNKTLGEFNTVMNNSQTELRIMGILAENQAITPLKQIILSNILQFKPATTVVNTQTETTEEFNPQQVRKAMLVFKLADGLRTPEDEMDLQLVREFYQYAAQDPRLQQGYDMVKVTTHIFENSGLNLKPFEITQPAAGQPPAGQQPPQPLPPQG